MKKLLSVLLLLCMLVSLLPVAAIATSDEPTEAPAVEGGAEESAMVPAEDAGETPSISDPPADSAENEGASDELADNNIPESSDEPAVLTVSDDSIAELALEGGAVTSDDDLLTVSCNDFGSATVFINGSKAPPVPRGGNTTYQVSGDALITVVAQPMDGYDKVESYGFSNVQEGPDGTFTFSFSPRFQTFSLTFYPSDSVTITYHTTDVSGNESVYSNHCPVNTPVYLNSEIVDTNAQLMLAGYAVGSEDGPVLPANSWQVFTENTDLYAKYEKAVKLTFHEMLGDREWTSRRYVLPNSPTTLADTEVQGVQAWSTEADGSGTRYECGAAYTFDKDTDLYAIRYSENITVTYYYGENYSLNQWHTQGKGTVVFFPAANQFAIQGVIKCWAVGSPDSKTVYLPGQEIPVDDDLDLYAVMADETVTITYNSGDERNSTYTKIVAKDCDILLPTDCSFDVPLDKQLAGWSLEKGGKILDETVKFTADTTLYAVWGDAILVTFDANDDIRQQCQVLRAVGGRIQIPSFVFNYFRRDGYKLAGWSLSADGNEPFDPKMLLTSNTTLYAIWKSDDVVIRDEDSGVSVTMPATEENAGLALIAFAPPEAQKKHINDILIKDVHGDVEKTHILDIYFIHKDSGEKKSIDGTRTVTVPIPEGWNPEHISVYYIDPDAGTAVDMHGRVSADGKTISFATSHFSYYALVQTKAEPAATATPAPTTAPASAAKHSPQTGDDSSAALWMALMGASALAIGALLTKKKHFDK